MATARRRADWCVGPPSSVDAAAVSAADKTLLRCNSSCNRLLTQMVRTGLDGKASRTTPAALSIPLFFLTGLLACAGGIDDPVRSLAQEMAASEVHGCSFELTWFRSAAEDEDQAMAEALC